MTRLYLRFFGKFQATIADQPLKITSSKSQALLAWLALQPEETHSRESLGALLYPEKDTSRAQQNLRKGLSRLRNALGDHLVVTRQQVQLNPNTDWGCDVNDWQQAIQQKRWRVAIDLYEGDFLLDVRFDSAEFEEWLLLKREWMRREHLQALAHQTERSLTENPTEAHHFARRRVALDPFDEAAHRDVMQTLALLERQSDALAHYDQLAEWLRHELDISPAAATDALRQEIKQGSVKPEQIVEQQTQKAATKTNLPSPATPFVGREKLLETIAERLATPECHLLTLLGMGGMGKTRLGIEFGQRQLGAFEDGVWFVPLAGLTHGASLDLFLQSVAVALGIPLPQQSSDAARLNHLVNELVGQRALIIFDNYEHVIDRVELLQALLANSTHLKLLVTSREQLNLQAEWLVDIGGLDFPPVGWDGDLPAAQEFEAVALFCGEAQRVSVAFEPTLAVVGITQLVNGMPLALQLAATWTRHFSAQEIAGEIEQNIDFLASKQRDLPARHRSMRAVFDESWQLLSPDLRRLLRQLAIFPNAFSVAAVSTICEPDVLLLSELTTHGLVQQQGEGRFGFHPAVGRYAAEKLENSADDAPLKDRFIAYYLNRVAQSTIQQFDELATFIEQDGDSVRQAWLWAAEMRQTEPMLAAVENYFYFHLRTGRRFEGLRLTQETLQLAEASVAPEFVLHLLCFAAEFHFGLGTQQDGLNCVEQAYEILDTVDHAYLRIRATQMEAELNWRLGNPAITDKAVQKALKLLEGHDFPRLKAEALMTYANICIFNNQTAESVALARQAVMLAQQINDPALMRIVYSSLGMCYEEDGQIEAANFAAQEALKFSYSLKNQHNITLCLNNLSSTYTQMNQFEAAAKALEEGLVSAEKLPNIHLKGLLSFNFAQTQASLFHFDRSRHFYLSGLKYFEEANNRLRIAQLKRRQGILYLRMAQWSDANAVLLDAVRRFTDLKSRSGKADSLALLALVHWRQNEGALAIEQAQIALDLGREVNRVRPQIVAHFALGNSFYTQANYQMAAVSFESAVAMCLQSKRTNIAAEARAGWLKALHKMGDCAAAGQQHLLLLQHLADGNLYDTLDPFSVYEACLLIEEDEALRQTAVRLLDGISAEISSPLDRHIYLHSFSSHQAFL